LKEEAKGNVLSETTRRFLNWDEAREMIGGGMQSGHTYAHLVLSYLTPDQQRQELAQSRMVLGEQLDTEANVLAYPVGIKSGFSDQNSKLAQEVGYRSAFSFHGEMNLRSTTRRYDVKRVGVSSPSWPQFRVQTIFCGLTGTLWP
jgi:peptidoglycan/xylan/chitin deacetylase (PgdA/CDA1 family)